MIFFHCLFCVLILYLYLDCARPISVCIHFFKIYNIIINVVYHDEVSLFSSGIFHSLRFRADYWKMF